MDHLPEEHKAGARHTNFSVPGVTIGDGFGQIVSTSTEARIIQFALKYRF